jgi:hypothetical protein
MTTSKLESETLLSQWSSDLKVMAGILPEHGFEFVSLVFRDKHVLLVTPRQAIADLPKPQELKEGVFEAKLKRTDAATQLAQVLRQTIPPALAPDVWAAFEALGNNAQDLKDMRLNWLVDRLQDTVTAPDAVDARPRSRRRP